jgi:hypothetical protein
MAGILRTDTIQNSNTSTIITQTNSTTITIGTTGQTVALASGASSSQVLVQLIMVQLTGIQLLKLQQ